MLTKHIISNNPSWRLNNRSLPTSKDSIIIKIMCDVLKQIHRIIIVSYAIDWGLFAPLILIKNMLNRESLSYLNMSLQTMINLKTKSTRKTITLLIYQNMKKWKLIIWKPLIPTKIIWKFPRNCLVERR